MTVRDVERLQEAIAHGEPLVNPAVRSTVAIGAAVSAELAVDWVKRILVGANQEAPAGEGPAVAFRAILGKLAEMGVEAVIRGERRHFSFLLAAEDLVAATIDIDETLTPILGRGLTEDERAYLRRLQAVGS